MNPSIFTIRLVALVVAFSSAIAAPEPEPEQHRGKWRELDALKFKTWEIAKYSGNNYPFKGGSKIFFFQTSSGLSFEIMAAHPQHWSSEDRTAKRQVFYLVQNDRYFLIEPGSKREEQLREKLIDAQGRLTRTKEGDPRDIGPIALFLKTRKQMFPLDG